MWRKFLTVFLCFTLLLTTTACGGSSKQTVSSTQTASAPAPVRNPVSSGEYPVQQATYDDGTGEYGLMLLNTPAGTGPLFRTSDVQMARLTDEQIQAGKSTYAEIEGDRALLYMTPDFQIQYVHNVTEDRTNPQTGQTETVIVRRESNFWTPFAGALAGQAVANMLFSPTYYVPPVYQAGTVMTGYGGYGNTYNQAVNSYQSRYNQPPAAVKNRQTLRTTGNLRSPSTTTNGKPNSTNANRSTGSGYGSSNLRSSGNSQSKQRTSSFGSGTSRRSSGFSSGRRRRR
ncbi:MAG: hypothetical protein J7545_07815 [Roseofilum sp. SBFL]|uniref:hypothetical protein n=1 Tax=unclassified Roseofilum TaxID=2620099 RepID=UPI001B24B38A|nr:MULTISPECIES: hypothetical protein [unclassified Roseofilum]MBP0012511.1 hypothetical protein [Roseofilum sp. SID3]MBP0024849.1 hypothetical protein [Roseofilum sp. SID2]MBP0028438.1 hypothetical protein [Roseofilum sp. Guam]MBP0037580.1 hypothetical protein [Roseofilum sp. SID1]MBP0041862.1 hypothetical protein [Roseofilum sp. SBFL]